MYFKRDDTTNAKRLLLDSKRTWCLEHVATVFVKLFLSVEPSDESFANMARWLLLPVGVLTASL